MSKPDQTNNIILYEGSNGDFRLEVHLEDETVWLSQEQMALLFDKSTKTISEHIVNIYTEGELQETETIQKIKLSGNSGFSTKPTNYYNLEFAHFIKELKLKTKLGLAEQEDLIKYFGDAKIKIANTKIVKINILK